MSNCRKSAAAQPQKPDLEIKNWSPLAPHRDGAVGTCPVCSSKNLENEYHFLVHCTAYDVREKSVLELVNKRVRVSSKSEQEYVKSILHEDAIKTTGKYLEVMYEMRKDHMKSKK